MARGDLRKAAEMLSGKRGTKGVSHDPAWDSGTARDSDTANGRKPAETLASPVPQDRGTVRDEVHCPTVPRPLGVGQWDTWDETAGTGDRCRQCTGFRRPGLSGGYCIARPDLPIAYGLLHHLPDDLGAACDRFAMSEAWE